jgi:hypothetical protein
MYTNETKEETQKFLDSLNEGDKVAVRVYGNHGTIHTVTKVTRITPTGIIKTADGNAFKGGQMRPQVAWDRTKYLFPVTQEILDEIKRRHLESKVSGLKTNTLTLDQLERIAAILGEHQEPTP